MKSHLNVLAVAVLAISAMSGCGGGGGGSEGGGSPTPMGDAPPAPSPPPAPTAVSFTSYSRQMYADSETSPAWEFEDVTFNFDSDDNPTAYDDLMPTEE